jgi:hypothetical protein
MNARTSDLARIQQLLNAQAFEVERQPRRSAFLTMFAETGPLRRQLYAKHIEFFHAGINASRRIWGSGLQIGRESLSTQLADGTVGLFRNR